ncbi:MAG: BofC C-terminal domain-containing protein [Oscillospiraceae bacterium]|jgi:hypothetical protein|nr:BofC C-terminal domain-containing protein [Oscillospiraceae bacterium]
MNGKHGKIGYICIGALAALLALLAVASYAAGAAYEAASEPEAAQEGAKDTRTYTLRDDGGTLSVFPERPERSDIPELKTEIETSGLREYDKSLLQSGIEVTGYEKLIGLLEDFSN